MNEAKDGIPELTREQLGKGVRGKYFSAYSKGNVVRDNVNVRQTTVSDRAAEEIGIGPFHKIKKDIDLT